MNTKHTQGEWELSQKAGTNDLCRIKDDRGGIIADAYWLGEGRGKDEAEANAKLIAAAPELLEALKNLLKSHRQLSFDANHNLNDTPIEQMAYLAIKKATE
jgi:hypothetical protein